MKNNITSIRFRLGWLVNLVFVLHISIYVLISYNAYKMITNDISFDNVLLSTLMLITNALVLHLISKKTTKLNRIYDKLMRENYRRHDV